MGIDLERSHLPVCVHRDVKVEVDVEVIAKWRRDVPRPDVLLAKDVVGGRVIFIGVRADVPLLLDGVFRTRQSACSRHPVKVDVVLVV